VFWQRYRDIAVKSTFSQCRVGVRGIRKGYSMNQKLTPKEAIRSYCRQCLGLNQFNMEAVKDCQGDTALNGACPFYPYRLGKRPSVKVFRQYCLYCTNGSREYVAECPVKTCPCFPYRSGKNPARQGQGDIKRFKNGFEWIKKQPESIFL
jgi:hypothetical protein